MQEYITIGKKNTRKTTNLRFLERASQFKHIYNIDRTLLCVSYRSRVLKIVVLPLKKQEKRWWWEGSEQKQGIRAVRIWKEGSFIWSVYIYGSKERGIYIYREREMGIDEWDSACDVFGKRRMVLSRYLGGYVIYLNYPSLLSVSIHLLWAFSVNREASPITKA